MSKNAITAKRISFIASIGGAVLSAALTLATPAHAVGAGGHDRPRSLAQPTTSTVVSNIDTVVSNSANGVAR